MLPVGRDERSEKGAREKKVRGEGVKVQSRVLRVGQREREYDGGRRKRGGGWEAGRNGSRVVRITAICITAPLSFLQCLFRFSLSPPGKRGMAAPDMEREGDHFKGTGTGWRGRGRGRKTLTWSLSPRHSTTLPLQDSHRFASPLAGLLLQTREASEVLLHCLLRLVV